MASTNLLNTVNHGLTSGASSGKPLITFSDYGKADQWLRLNVTNDGKLRSYLLCMIREAWPFERFDDAAETT